MSTELPPDPADIGLADPRLAGLLGALTARPTPSELKDESAALAMFRDHVPPQAVRSGRQETVRDVRPEAARPAPRGAAGGGSRRGRWLAAAAAVVIIGGFGGAAYAAVLPAPVQHAAYRVLGFAGVSDPSSQHHGGGPARGQPPGRIQPPGSPSTSRRSQPQAASTSPATAHPSASGSVTPSPPVSVRLSLTASESEIAAGGSEQFAARLTGAASSVAGVPVSLAERPAGQSGWQLAASARTQSDGSAVLTIPSLATNAVFRLVGPPGTRSAPVGVTVVPAVSASILSEPGGRTALVTVSVPLAVPGNPVVLQVRSGGGWRSVAARRLQDGGQARLTVRRGQRQLEYRVVLPATRTHDSSVSEPVLEPAR